MASLTAEAEQTLLAIFIGQHINPAGILKSDLQYNNCLNELLSPGIVKENHWFSSEQLLTTNVGSEIAKGLIEQKILKVESQLRTEFKKIPGKVLGFFVIRFISKKLTFKTEKPYFAEKWEDRILSDGQIWSFWENFFETLTSLGLCIKTHSYTPTKEGTLKELFFVICPETQEYLEKHYSLSDFSLSQQETLVPYPVLTSIYKMIGSDNLELLRQRYYELLESNSVTEGQVAGIINRMNQRGIASEYVGLSSDNKPFEVIDYKQFPIYLEADLIEPAINHLLEKGGLIKQYAVDARIPSLSEIKSELGFLDKTELGDFYILVSALEKDLREFIKAKIGKGWDKRIEGEMPAVYKRLQEKKRKDENWGIDVETDILNYADLEDYIEIIKKFNRMFVDAERQLSNVITYLEIWYVYGRNPIMHSRTVTRQKFETTRSAIDFLKKWMAAKSSTETT